jgi:hypothetical protein
MPETERQVLEAYTTTTLYEPLIKAIDYYICEVPTTGEA